MLAILAEGRSGEEVFWGTPTKGDGLGDASLEASGCPSFLLCKFLSGSIVDHIPACSSCICIIRMISSTFRTFVEVFGEFSDMIDALVGNFLQQQSNLHPN